MARSSSPVSLNDADLSRIIDALEFYLPIEMNNNEGKLIKKLKKEKEIRKIVKSSMKGK